jgi:hypothetical protein
VVEGAERAAAAWITAHALEAWLVASGFAETNGEPGRLVLTTLGREVGGALEFLGSWRPTEALVR